MNTLSVTAVAVCTLGLAAFAAAQTLTQTEREQGRHLLEESRTEVVGAVKGLSKAQWDYKPAPDRWSIAEIVEHIVLTQELVLGPISQQLAKAPAPPSSQDSGQVDQIVIHQMTDRSSKFKAPDPLQPTGRWTPEESLERLTKNVTHLITYLESTPDLRQHALPAPPVKALSEGAFEVMDGYEWVITTATHAQRHTKQILEVKAEANFPAK